ncbi:MAG: DinB family protein [Anaerolineae bacterium]
MSEDTREQLISKLESSQSRLTALLDSVADNQDWQPSTDAWSFRYHAAHLATVEREAYWDRITRIAAGENPHYEPYFSTDRDFSQYALRNSLSEWAVTRRKIIHFVRSLPRARIALTGTHDTFGTITVLDVLQGMVDHDREHLKELTRLVADCQTQ